MALASEVALPKYIPPHLRNRDKRAALDDKPLPLLNLVTLKYEPHSRQVASFLNEVNEGLHKYAPEPCEEGVNGTYFIKNKDGETVAIFKPNDEEGDSVNNPKNKDLAQEDFGSIRKGIKAGEAGHRELAAYLLDSVGFHGVPMTTLVSIEHPSFQSAKNPSAALKTKFGSLQRFVANNGASWDVAPKVFPVNEVHKIGILDVMILNSDRHGGNILFNRSKETGYSLIPIDHSYSLPHSLEHAWFDWFYWPQVRQPFDKETMSYIQNFDVDAKAQVLLDLGISIDSVQIFKTCTHLLKILAAKNFTLFEIASVICRKDLSKPSLLENLYLQAEKEVTAIEMKENSQSLTPSEKEALFLQMFRSLIEKLEISDLPPSPSSTHSSSHGK